MARNDAEEISALEMAAARVGYSVVVQLRRQGEREFGDQFHWIASHLGSPEISEKNPAQLRHLRQEISKHIKELSEVIRAKHIQHHLPFSCGRDRRSPLTCVPLLCSFAWRIV